MLSEKRREVIQNICRLNRTSEVPYIHKPVSEMKTTNIDSRSTGVVLKNQDELNESNASVPNRRQTRLLT